MISFKNIDQLAQYYKLTYKKQCDDGLFISFRAVMSIY